jgi:hypothetical protein
MSLKGLGDLGVSTVSCHAPQFDRTILKLEAHRLSIWDGKVLQFCPFIYLHYGHIRI